jgi:hypothetical protein
MINDFIEETTKTSQIKERVNEVVNKTNNRMEKQESHDSEQTIAYNEFRNNECFEDVDFNKRWEDYSIPGSEFGRSLTRSNSELQLALESGSESGKTVCDVKISKSLENSIQRMQTAKDDLNINLLEKDSTKNINKSSYVMKLKKFNTMSLDLISDDYFGENIKIPNKKFYYIGNNKTAKLYKFINSKHELEYYVCEDHSLYEIENNELIPAVYNNKSQKWIWSE